MSSSLPPASSSSNKILELEEQRSSALKSFNSKNRGRIDFEDGYVPVGIRFFPRDHQVIQPYLLSKILGTKHTPLYPIKDMDLSTFDPNDVVFGRPAALIFLDYGLNSFFSICWKYMDILIFRTLMSHVGGKVRSNYFCISRYMCLKIMYEELVSFKPNIHKFIKKLPLLCDC